MHSSRMRTCCLLTVFRGVSGPRGVSTCLWGVWLGVPGLGGVCLRGSAPGGVCFGGLSTLGGVCFGGGGCLLQGVSALGGLSTSGGVCLGGSASRGVSGLGGCLPWGVVSAPRGVYPSMH